MKKLTILSIFFMLVLSITVFAVGDVDVLSVTANPTSLEPSQASTITIFVGNADTQASTIPTVIVSSSQLTSGSNTIQVTQTQTINNLVNNTNQSTTLTVSVPSNARPGSYSGIITAVDGNDNTNSDTMAYTIVVNQKSAVQIFTSTNASLGSIDLSSEPGEEVSKTIILKNTGNVDLTNIALSTVFDDLTDEDDNEARFTVTPNTISSLTVGSEVSLIIKADTDSGFEIKKLTGNLRISPQGLGSIDVPLTLDVQPNACSPSSLPRGLSVSIESPEDNDDFGIDETVNVVVEVDNNANDDKRVRVEVVAYNLDENKRIFSQTQEIRVDEDETEEFNFDLDLTEFDLEDDDEVGLFVKAFERGDEDITCDDDQLDFNVIVPAHRVNLESINLNPITTQCGTKVTFSGVLKNVGDNAERVTVNVKNNNIGSFYSTQYSLGVSSSNREQLVNLDFDVPANTPSGNYVMDIFALYGTTTTTYQKTLTVTCGSTPSTTVTTTNVNTGTQPHITGLSVVEKDIFEKFNTASSNIPTSVWVLANILLVILIIIALVFVFKRRH